MTSGGGGVSSLITVNSLLLLRSFYFIAVIRRGSLEIGYVIIVSLGSLFHSSKVDHRGFVRVVPRQKRTYRVHRVHFGWGTAHFEVEDGCVG